MRKGLCAIVLMATVAAGAAWGAISTIQGIAVQESKTKWNNVQDVSSGPTFTSGGIPAAMYGWSGTEWRRMNYDNTSGLSTQSYLYIWDDASGAWRKAPGDNTSGIKVQSAASMASTFATGQVVVDNTARQIVAANTARRSLVVRNHGNVDAYIGNANTVTTLTGLLVKSGESLVLDKNTSAVFAIVAADNTTFGYLQE